MNKHHRAIDERAPSNCVVQCQRRVFTAVANCRCVFFQVLSAVVTIRVIDVNEFPAEFASQFFSFSVRRGIGNIAGQVIVSMRKYADIIILYAYAGVRRIQLMRMIIIDILSYMHVPCRLHCNVYVIRPIHFVRATL